MGVIIATSFLVTAIALFFLNTTIKESFSSFHNKKVIDNIQKRDQYRREILENTEATGVVFFKTHNHDGRTSHTKDYKITCVRGTRLQEKVYRDILVDEDYINILSHIFNSGFYDYSVEAEKDSLFKRMLKKEGAGRALLFYIKSTYTGVFYVKICKKGTDPFSNEDFETIKKYVNKIKKLHNVYQNF